MASRAMGKPAMTPPTGIKSILIDQETIAARVKEVGRCVRFTGGVDRNRTPPRATERGVTLSERSPSHTTRDSPQADCDGLRR